MKMSMSDDKSGTSDMSSQGKLLQVIYSGHGAGGLDSSQNESLLSQFEVIDRARL